MATGRSSLPSRTRSAMTGASPLATDVGCWISSGEGSAEQKREEHRAVHEQDAPGLCGDRIHGFAKDASLQRRCGVGGGCRDGAAELLARRRQRGGPTQTATTGRGTCRQSHAARHLAHDSTAGCRGGLWHGPVGARARQRREQGCGYQDQTSNPPCHSDIKFHHSTHEIHWDQYTRCRGDGQSDHRTMDQRLARGDRSRPRRPSLPTRRKSMRLVVALTSATTTRTSSPILNRRPVRSPTRMCLVSMKR